MIVDMEVQHFKADFFKALAHPLRIRILELLAEGNKSVNELQTLIGLDGSAVSQQLAILRHKSIVKGTKNGNRVIYSLQDPLILELLQVAKRIFNNRLVDAIAVFDRMKE